MEIRIACIGAIAKYGLIRYNTLYYRSRHRAPQVNFGAISHRTYLRNTRCNIMARNRKKSSSNHTRTDADLPAPLGYEVSATGPDGEVASVELPPEQPGGEDASSEKEESAGASFPIVGIGASAGGLEAFERFFKAMPPDSGMAFVIVQHLDPTHRSILTDLVKKFTSMNVFEVQDDMLVEPDCVYVIPPNHDMAIRRGRLHLLEQATTLGRRLPIDFFFRSLAADQGANAICIVLSGTGTEGTLGLKAIKEWDGMVMVQSPDSAQYDGMPRSAVFTGLADFVLPPEKMPEQLTAYVRRTVTPEVRKNHLQSAKPSALQLQKVLILLHAQTGHDFASYKQNTIIRRIERRMSVNQIDDMADYVRYLGENPSEVDTLFKELLIEVTNFFRDPEAFASLREKVIPQLFRERPPDSPIRVWVPGCSTGEEAYSIAMLLRDHMDEHRREYRPQVFATDIDRNAIEVGRSGTYTDSISADIPSESYHRFFLKEGHTFQVRKPIRDMLVFAVQSVIKDPPFSKLDLVSCRNLLIYMGSELQKRVLHIFHYALKPGGFLFLGSSESIGEFADLFSVVDRKWKIYERRGDVVRHPSVAGHLQQPVPHLTSDLTDREVKPKEKISLREIAERTLLHFYAPAAAIINEKGEVLYIHGRTGKFLEPTQGEASMNIVAMAREGLKLELGAALRKAIMQKQEVRYENLRVKTNGDVQYVDLTVRPLTEPPSTQGLLLVMFDEHPAPLSTDAAVLFEAPEEARRRIAELEQELNSTREYLRTTVVELETSNEELKSANEELQSANEELQSTNEEVETSGEELQSVNEELMTVNAELETKLEELSRANSDLNNLLTSTDIGTIFLDEVLRVDRFTPAAARFVNLIPSDVGRPIAHIMTNLEDSSLVEDARAVLDTLSSREREVRTLDGRWSLMRVLPYRTVDNVITGVVVAFVDITEQKRVEEQLRVVTRAVEQSPAMVIITNLQNEIEYVNPKFTMVTGYTREEAIGKNPQFLRSNEQPREFFQRMWNTLIAGQEWRGEIRNRRKNGELFWEAVSISPLKTADGTITQFLFEGEDITELMRLEGLRGVAARLAAVVYDSDDAITVLDFEGRILAWNRSAAVTYGWSEAEALEMNIRDLVPEARIEQMLDMIRRLKAGEAVEPISTQRHARDGKALDVRMSVTCLLDDSGKPLGISVTERNITEEGPRHDG